MSESSWDYATDLVRRFLSKPARLQHLMERLPVEEDGGKRRACQALLYGTVRDLSLLEEALGTFLKKKPKPRLYSRLLVASFEILRDPEKSALVVDHAVEQIKRKCSRVEVGLANAVLRKVGKRLHELQDAQPKNARDLAVRYSHPQWMVERWLGQFEFSEVERYLEWNQSEAELLVLALGEEQAGALEELGFQRWKERYFKAAAMKWATVQEALDRKLCYVQNAAAGGAVGLASEIPEGGRVLDLCSAPGGKSIAVSRMIEGKGGEVVSVDLPGPRLDRLRSNLENFEIGNVSVQGADLFDLNISELGEFDSVLLDAPCSNSGVMQRKVDVKWRQSKTQMGEILGLQKRMLIAASQFVKRGGTLIYSTCSIDPEENAAVAEWFVTEGGAGEFELKDSIVSLPWRDQQDGAGAFRFVRLS